MSSSRRARTGRIAALLVLGLAPAACGSGGDDAGSEDGGIVAAAATPPYGIYRFRVDGSGKQQLTGEQDRYPVWSPDGRRIAFIRNANELTEVGELYVMDADGENAERVVLSASPPVGWLADGEVAFGRGSGFWAVAPSGEGLRRLPGLTEAAWPAWSSDGRRVVFHRTKYPGGLFVANADGTAPRRLISDPELGFAAHPAWSPDRRRVAYDLVGASVGVAQAVKVIEVGDRSVRTLLKSGTTGGNLAWAPDGRRIAYADRRPVDNRQASGIFVVPSQGGQPRLLVRGPYLELSWAPAKP